MSTNRILETKSLAAGYAGETVVRDVSISVFHNEIVALVGRNGSGKSTILKSIVGLIPVSHGEILVDGNKLNQISPRLMLRSGISYIPQTHNVFDDINVRDNLRISLLASSRESSQTDAIDCVLEAFPVLRYKYKLPAKALSGGEKQELALACSLVTRPRLILLDEPSVGLSANSAIDVFSFLSTALMSWKLSVLLVEHNLEIVNKYATRIYTLNNGECMLEVV